MLVPFRALLAPLYINLTRYYEIYFKGITKYNDHYILAKKRQQFTSQVKCKKKKYSYNS